MEFSELANRRQSCRCYDPRPVEDKKLAAVLEAARLAPSACNGQPYHITVCRGETARAVAAAVTGMGLNKFAAQAPVLLVLSEMPYVKSAAVGAKLKGNDYRSIDIGIAAAYLTAQAADLGLGSCIMGWLDDEKIRRATGAAGAVRLVISLGYPADTQREKKRKSLDQLVTYAD
ncbi:MAG: nitroreductase family protein [Eubacteriales bacterium]|nr:nitroreductase family protein [Eubacteriales bacterium]